MQLSIILFDLTVLLGILQGSIMALMLYFMPGKSHSKTLFCWVLIIITLLSFEILLRIWSFGTSPRYPTFF
jgi:hypothetical protein